MRARSREEGEEKGLQVGWAGVGLGLGFAAARLILIYIFIYSVRFDSVTHIAIRFWFEFWFGFSENHNQIISIKIIFNFFSNQIIIQSNNF